MLYLIGIGTGDFTIYGLTKAKACSTIYLEGYTSVPPEIDTVERQIGKPPKIVERAFVEDAQELLRRAKNENVALLIMGDPLLATTHTVLVQRAHEQGIKTEIIHNASIFSLVGETGLQLYKFGKVTSVPFPAPGFEPTTPIEVLRQNQSINAHTLFLLDLNPKEGKYLTIPEALRYLGKLGVPDQMAIACARLGSPDQKIVYGNFRTLQDVEFGNPPYCIIIPAKLHFAEEEFLERFKSN